MINFGFRFAGQRLRSAPTCPPKSRDCGTKEGDHGEVAEWSIAPDSKSGGPQGPGGSNPSLSATLRSKGASGGTAKVLCAGCLPAGRSAGRRVPHVALA